MSWRVITLGLVLAATWLLWSGIYKPLLLVLGLTSCVLVILLARRTGFFDQDVYSLRLGPSLPGYWLWLLKEIVKSNLQVAGVVLKPTLNIQPEVVNVDASDLPLVSRATLANAITLTPGTLTMDVDSGVLEVHCLTSATAADLQKGEMLARARSLERT